MREMRLIRSDYFVIATAIILVVVHFITNLVQTQIYNNASTAVQAEALFKFAEANPLAEVLFQTQGITYMIAIIFLPALILGFYYTVRRYNLASDYVIEHIAFTFFIAAILNVLNDVSILIGLML